MKKDYFVVACIIDKSGSMFGTENDTIGGFNSFLRKQKKAKVEIDFSLVLFDTNIEQIYNMEKVKKVKELNKGTYVVGGATALNDAIGITVYEIGNKINKMPEEERPSKVIVAILTDGEENSSRGYTSKQISQMIEKQQDKYSWEFIYLAANQDAFITGGAYNFKHENISNFTTNSVGISKAYTTLSETVFSYIK